ncbi:MAG: hypothetical protein ABI797_05405 [Chloroflexota bacterium]
MTTKRASVKLTTRTLTVGTLAAAALLGIGLGLDALGVTDSAAFVGNIGVCALLLTPAAGLLATWWELKRVRPGAAWMSVVVLGVLVLATVIAVATRA